MLDLASRYLRSLGLTLRSFLRYWGVAFFAFLADLGITAILSAAGLPLRANALATGIVMTIILFWLNRSVVFGYFAGAWEREIIPFLLVSIAHMGLSQALLTLTTTFVSDKGVWGDTLTRAFILGLLAITKFIVVSKFLFGGASRLS